MSVPRNILQAWYIANVVGDEFLGTCSILGRLGEIDPCSILQSTPRCSRRACVPLYRARRQWVYHARTREAHAGAVVVAHARANLAHARANLAKARANLAKALLCFEAILGLSPPLKPKF